ncbi:MAG TPA: reverse transcriptase domain-containing protein [Streptosporangiaceae bacterium]|nr:reverse transcriptase domain-containing protein [Streptosporangiaceae bacterium]
MQEGQYESSVPTVQDRVVQAALKLVLEPIFEADFQPCSYGFRPGRRQHDAIAEIHHLATHGYEWALEADIKACFDEIGHVPLMDRLRVRIKDKRILALVKAFLKAGIMTPDGEEGSYSGTPQGGILSPLLASIALPALDDHFAGQWQQQMKTSSQRQARRRHGLGNWRMIRFAGDFVVMVHGERRHAGELRQEVTGVLAAPGLRLAAEKTRVVCIDEGSGFLSITIRRMRKRGTGKRYVCTKPSRNAIQAVKDKVSVKTYRSTLYQEPEVLIAGINETLRGQAGYHRHGVSKAVFSAVDSHAWNRIMRWLRNKYTHKTSSIGMPELRRRFCLPGTWKFAYKETVFTGASSVAVTRYRYRGTLIPSPYPDPSAVPSG